MAEDVVKLLGAAFTMGCPPLQLCLADWWVQDSWPLLAMVMTSLVLPPWLPKVSTFFTTCTSALAAV